MNVRIYYEPAGLETDIEEEKNREFILFGISKDNFKFEKDGFDLRFQSSKGEKRIFLFFFYFAVAEIMKKNNILLPLLLDDLSSTLDYNLVKNYIENREGQIIIPSLRPFKAKNIITI